MTSGQKEDGKKFHVIPICRQMLIVLSFVGKHVFDRKQ